MVDRNNNQSSSSGLSGNISDNELDEMHYEKRHFETQISGPKRASQLVQYQLKKFTSVGRDRKPYGVTKGGKS